jgi:hypothetical protein
MNRASILEYFTTIHYFHKKLQDSQRLKVYMLDELNYKYSDFFQFFSFNY